MITAILMVVLATAPPFNSQRPGAANSHAVCTQTITTADGTVLDTFDCAGNLAVDGGLISGAPIVCIGSECFNLLLRGGQPAIGFSVDQLPDGGQVIDYPDGGATGNSEIFEITPRPSDGVVEFNFASHRGSGVQTECEFAPSGAFTCTALRSAQGVSAPGLSACQAGIIGSDDFGGGAPCTGATTLQGWASGNEFTWQHWNGTKYAYLRGGSFQPVAALIPGTTLKTCTVSTYDETNVPEGAIVTVPRSGGTPTKQCICVNTAGTPAWESETLAAGAVVLVSAGGSSTVCP